MKRGRSEKKLGVYVACGDASDSNVAKLVDTIRERDDMTLLGPLRKGSQNDFKTRERIFCCLSSFADVVILCGNKDAYMKIIDAPSGAIEADVPTLQYGDCDMPTSRLSSTLDVDVIVHHILKLGLIAARPHVLPAKEGWYQDGDTWWHIVKDDNGPPPE